MHTDPQRSKFAYLCIEKMIFNTIIISADHIISIQ